MQPPLQIHHAARLRDLDRVFRAPVAVFSGAAPGVALASES